jgi:hypothetical protein
MQNPAKTTLNYFVTLCFQGSPSWVYPFSRFYTVENDKQADTLLRIPNLTTLNLRFYIEPNQHIYPPFPVIYKILHLNRHGISHVHFLQKPSHFAPAYTIPILQWAWYTHVFIGTASPVRILRLLFPHTNMAWFLGRAYMLSLRPTILNLPYLQDLNKLAGQSICRPM